MKWERALEIYMTQSLPTDTNSLQSSSYCHTGGTGTDMLRTHTNAVFVGLVDNLIESIY